MTTFEKVAAILANHKEIDAGDIAPESTLQSLGLDSLDTVELLISFEEEFKTELNMDDNLQTVADFVKLIETGRAHD